MTAKRRTPGVAVPTQLDPHSFLYAGLVRRLALIEGSWPAGARRIQRRIVAKLLLCAPTERFAIVLRVALRRGSPMKDRDCKETLEIERPCSNKAITSGERQPIQHFWR